MAFVHPSAVDGSYLQARSLGFTGRYRQSSIAIPGLTSPQRDLTDELAHEVQQANVPAVAGTALRVFARVRPDLPGDFSLTEHGRQETVVEIPNSVHLLMHAPKDSATYRNATNGTGSIVHRYTFTQLFRPATTQQQLFRQTTLNHIEEFVNGQSCLLFTYGATNSGKTFTVQGTPQEPGLLPRSLDVLFNSIGTKLYPRADIQPRAYTDVVKVSPREEQAALRLLRDTLILGADDTAGSASIASEDSVASSAMYRSQESLNTISLADSMTDLRCAEIGTRQRDPACVSISNQPNARFSVWVSYVEIYNEHVFDLLERPGAGRRRTVLHLGLDRKGNTYVKGLRQVQVRSADEACQVIRAGRHNLHFASNRLNDNSSRSHCVLTVKLIRMLNMEDPSVARISMFSVCDLAGSERVEKTVAQGLRMKEAGNINTSLMVLGRCIKAMRQNQCRGGADSVVGARLVPYRDSKLTRLFQSFLSGTSASRVTMVVNVSPSPVVFDETIQVLKFSALAKQVSVQQPQKRRAPTRFSVMARRSVAAAGGAPVRPRPLMLDTSAEESEHQNLLGMVESLRGQLIDMRRMKSEMETNLRKELCEGFEEMLVKIEEDHTRQVQETKRLAEEQADAQVEAVAKGLRAHFESKRRREDDSDTGGEEDEKVDDLLQEIKTLEERSSAAEQRSQLLEQQIEAEAEDRAQMSVRAAQQRDELAALTSQLADANATNQRLKTELSESEERCRRYLNCAEDDPLVVQLSQQVDSLKEQLRFKEMDLQEARDLLKEGSEEFVQAEADRDRCQVQVSALSAQLTARDDAARDQLAQYQDLEQLLAAKTQTLAERELKLQTLVERCTCGQRVSVAPAAAIPEEVEQGEAADEELKPNEMSFGSRMRHLRSKTGSVLQQVADSSGGRLLQLQSQVNLLQTRVEHLEQAEASLQTQNQQLQRKITEMEGELDLASGESENLLRTTQKLTSHIATQERVMVDLSSRYLAATTPGRTPLHCRSPVKCSTPAGLNDTCGFEEAERQLLEEAAAQQNGKEMESPKIKVTCASREKAGTSSAPDCSDGDSELQQLRRQLSAEREKLAELEDAHQKLNARFLSEVSVNADLMKRHMETTTANSEFAANRDQLQSTVDLMAAEVEKVAQLQSDVDELKRENAQLSEVKPDAEQEAEESEERLLAEVKAERDNWEAERAAYEQRMQEMQAAREKTEAAHAACEQRVQEMQAERERKDAEHAACEQRVQDMQAEREKTEAESAACEQRMQEMQAEREKTEAERAACEQRVQEMQVEIEKMEAERATCEQRAQEMQAERQMTEAERATCEQRAQEMQAEREKTEAVRLAAEKQLQDLESEVASGREKAEAEIAAAEERLQAVLTETASVRDALQSQLAAVASERDRAEQRADAAMADLHQAQKECERLRDQLNSAATSTTHERRLSDVLKEVADLQKDYKHTLMERNEARADMAVLERELKEATSRSEAAPDAELVERLRQRETEVEVLQARVAALVREEEAFNVIKSELDAKKEELRNCNVVELRAQLERTNADRGHLKDELEKRSNELMKLNIQMSKLKQKISEKDEDMQKVRDERVRMMSRSEADIRRKNDELNRERHESAHLREMMARLTPKSSSVLMSELDSARAECRRKESRIEQLVARLRSSNQPEVIVTAPSATPRRAAASAGSDTELTTPSATPRRAAASAHIDAQTPVPTDDDECHVTPMVLKKRARSTRKSARSTKRATAVSTTDAELDGDDTDDFEPPPKSRMRTRRAPTKASTASVRFADENDDPDSVSETGSSVSRGSRPGASEVLTEKPATPADQAAPARANKSTSKRKLYKRCSNTIVECSPVEVDRTISPRKVVTRSLRSRKK